MFPNVAPPVWTDPQPRPGRMAAAIVRNAPEIDEDPARAAELAKCTVALIGLPDDTGVELNHGRPGARRGPAAFRSALARYGVAIPADPFGLLSSTRLNSRAYPHVLDVGDVIVGQDIHQTHDRISQTVEAVVRRGLFPIGIGGGHDLTFAFVRGVARALGSPPPLGGIYFDAHLDVRPEVGSGMPFRALIEGGHVDPRALRCVGYNPLVTLREHAEYLLGRGATAVPITAVQSHTGVADPIDRSRPTFVSLDLDVLDGAFAPGVSAVNPAGLSPRELQTPIWSAGRSPNVCCFDIMELNPDHDVDGRTARIAAHMFLTFLGGLSERVLSPRPGTRA